MPRKKGSGLHDSYLHQRCSTAEKAEWRKAASLDGEDLAAWVRRTLNREARLTLEGAKRTK